MFARIESVCREWLDPDGPVAGKRSALVLAAVAAALLGGAVALGPYPITLFPQDTMYMLVQGDFLLKGLRPYIDCYSIHGPFPAAFATLGLWLEGVSLDAVVTAQALGAAVFGLLTFVVARNRLHPVLATLFAASVIVFLISCSPVGEKSWRSYSFAMWYNSIGYVIYAVVSLHLLAPPRVRGGVARAVETAVVGFCLAAAFLTKITFFAPLAAAYFVGELVVPRRPSDRAYGLAGLAAAATAIFAFMAVFSGSVAGYLGFMDAMSFRVNPWFLSLRFLHYTRTIGVFLLGAFVLLWLAKDAGVLRRTRREFGLIIPMLCGVLLSASTAAQDLETLPFLGVLTLGLASAVAAAAAAEGRPLNGTLTVCALGVALLLTAHTPKNSLLSCVFARMRVPTLTGEMVGGSSTDSADAIGPTDPRLFEMVPKAYAERQLAAIRLLAAHGERDRDPVFVATSTSCISLLSGFPYAKGQVAWWPFVYSRVPTDIPLLDDDLLDDAEWVLRDLTEDLCWDYIQHYRGDYFAESFTLVGETEGWELYGRVDAGAPGEPVTAANAVGE